MEVASPSLGRLIVRMADVPNLASPPIDLTAAVSLARDGRLDLSSPLAALARPHQPLIWSASLGRVDRIVGRSKELRAMDAWYGSGSRVLLVTGLAGIGKSALVAAWISRRQESHVFGLQLQRTSTVAALLSELGKFLAALNRRTLAGYVAHEGSLDFGLIARLLKDELSGLQTILVLDAVERASGHTIRLLNEVFLPLADASDTRVVLTSRRALPWLADEMGNPRTVQILRLEGLEPSQATTLLRSKGFTAEEADLHEIAVRTRGHPLLLRLVAQGGREGLSSVKQYLEDEIWGTLTQEQKRVLRTAALLRRPVPNRILEAAAGVDARILESIRAKNLLEVTAGGDFQIHDLVREFVQERVKRAKARDTHARIARQLLLEREPRARWEGVHHLLAAGQDSAAATWLDSEGAPLLDSVAAQDIASLAKESPVEGMTPFAACVFSELYGDGLRILGHIGPALRQYEHAIEIARREGQSERIPRLLWKLGFLERCRNRYSKALGHLVEANARMLNSTDIAERAEIFRETALVQEALGEFSEAERHLNEAVDLATDQSDWSALCRTLLTLGNLEVVRGNRDQGAQYCFEALRIAEKSGNLTEVARAHVVVGYNLVERGHVAEGLGHYERGLELGRLLGNLRITTYATLNRAAAFLDLGRLDTAGTALQEANGYARILEEPDTRALLKVNEGQWEMGMGRWGRAKRSWEEALAELRAHGSPSDLLRSLKYVGKFELERGEESSSLAHLSEAREIARKIGNVMLLSELEGLLTRGKGVPSPSDSA